MEELLEVKGCRVVCIHCVFLNLCDDIAWLLRLHEVLGNTISPLMIFKGCPISLECNFGCSQLLGTIVEKSVDPVELIDASFSPERILAIDCKLLLLLIVLAEWTWFGHEEGFSLVSNIWKLIHVFTASVVLLSLGVSDGITKTFGKSLTIGTVNSNVLVVVLEVLNSLDLLELGLKIIFNGRVKAAMIVIESFLNVLPLSAESLLDHLAQRVENHCDLETSKSSLVAYLFALVFQDDFFTLVLRVSVIELRDLLDNPESLSIKLLLQV